MALEGACRPRPVIGKIPPRPPQRSRVHNVIAWCLSKQLDNILGLIVDVLGLVCVGGYYEKA